MASEYTPEGSVQGPSPSERSTTSAWLACAGETITSESL